MTDDEPNTSICPLCGTGNACAMADAAATGEPCWCTSVQIPADLLAKIPPEARNRVCICRSCIEDRYGHQPPPHDL